MCVTLFDDGAFKNGIASCHDMVNWVFEKGHHFEEKQCCILIWKISWINIVFLSCYINIIYLLFLFLFFLASKIQYTVIWSMKIFILATILHNHNKGQFFRLRFLYSHRTNSTFVLTNSNFEQNRCKNFNLELLLFAIVFTW